jgi:hypothetical protein
VTGAAISAFSQSFSQRKIIAMFQRGLPWTARIFSNAVNLNDQAGEVFSKDAHG